MPTDGRTSTSRISRFPTGCTAAAARFRIGVHALVNSNVVDFHRLREQRRVVRWADRIATNGKIQEQMECLVEGCISETKRVGAEGIIQAVRTGRVVDPVFIDDLGLEMLPVHKEPDAATLPLERIFMEVHVGIECKVGP